LTDPEARGYKYISMHPWWLFKGTMRKIEEQLPKKFVGRCWWTDGPRIFWEAVLQFFGNVSAMVHDNS